MSRENVEVVRDLVCAFNTRDIEAMVAAAHPDGEIVAARSAIEGVYRGHDGVRRWASELFEMTDVYELRAEDLREVGDWVVMLGRQTGRGRDSGAYRRSPRRHHRLRRTQNHPNRGLPHARRGSRSRGAAGVAGVAEDLDVVRRRYAAVNAGTMRWGAHICVSGWSRTSWFDRLAYAARRTLDRQRS